MDIDNVLKDSLNDVLEENTKDFCQDQNKNAFQTRGKGEKSGRKNRGITNKSYDEKLQEFNKERKELGRTENAQAFSGEIVEKVQGEIIEKDDLKAFQECYKLTCESVLEQFRIDNEELTKKHPSNWNKQLLVQIKRNVPKVGIEDIDKLKVVWEVLKDLVLTIGLNPTMENFFYITNTYREQYEKRKELNPKYSEFVQQIYNDSRDALVNELHNNPYTQTNKYFLAKSIYGIIEKTEPKQIEVHHDIRQYDNLPMFRTSEK